MANCSSTFDDSPDNDCKMWIFEILENYYKAFIETILIKKKKKRSLLKDELGLEDTPVTKEDRAPADGGLDTDEVARQVLPFVEGNGEVSFEDLLEYTALERKVLRYHLNALVKAERLERIGTGKHAVFSSFG